MVKRKKGQKGQTYKFDTVEYCVPFLYIEMEFSDANFHLDRKEHIL